MVSGAHIGCSGHVGCRPHIGFVDLVGVCELRGSGVGRWEHRRASGRSPDMHAQTAGALRCDGSAQDSGGPTAVCLPPRRSRSHGGPSHEAAREEWAV